MKLEQKTNKRLSPGAGDPLGATIGPDGTNFAVFSQYAAAVYLLLFEPGSPEPTDVISLPKNEFNVWHIYVHDVRAGQHYGYIADGEYNPAEGFRFNPHKLLLDPYAKAISAPCIDQDMLLFAYDTLSPGKDLAMDTRDNLHVMPKSLVIDDAFDWQNDQRIHIPRKDLIIYETHVKGFTAHPSSQIEPKGTYLSFIQKISHLKELGINAVELLPVHEIYMQDFLIKKGLTNYWGYDTIGFFAPALRYSSGQYPGCQVHEFKTLVRELHKAGIEVILDVVYNHTAEGNELGPTLAFKGLDNPSYYYLVQGQENEPYRYYRNDTGCGNTFNIENPAALKLVLDSLRYWVNMMHVDGFRFDLGSILGKVNGTFSKDAAFFKAIEKDPVLSSVKLIAEPWDLTTYQVGNFPKGWMEWNGKFRDTARRFLRGDDGQTADLARRMSASSDLYETQGRHTFESVNFITCHDGFTLWDLFSYNEKHNEANGEDNRDGANDNHSFNCGFEGETESPAINTLRKQMVKNALCILFFSCGTPMILGGDEIIRTKKGNNNTWCQDNELSWMDWSMMELDREILEFCKKAIKFRRQYIHCSSQDVQAPIPNAQWFNKKLETPPWDNPRFKTLCFLANEHFFIFNAHQRGSTVALPAAEGKRWHRVIDTALKAGEDFRLDDPKVLGNQEKFYCHPRSIAVLRRASA